MGNHPISIGLVASLAIMGCTQTAVHHVPESSVVEPSPEMAETDLDELDLAALGSLATLFRISASNGAEIWSEEATGRRYCLAEIPFYLVRRDEEGRPEKGFLINHPDPPGEAPRVVHPDLEILGEVIRYDLDIEVLEGRRPFSLEATAAGASVVAFPYSLQGFSASPDSEVVSRPWSPHQPWFPIFLVHETFHRYQRVEGRWSPFDSCQDPASYPLTVQNLALALLEDRVLKAGLIADEVSDMVVALERFHAVRKLRHDLPEMNVDGRNRVVCTDEDQERREGTARFIENSYGLLAAEVVEDVAAHIRKGLEWQSIRSGLNVRMHFGFLSRFYQTGAAVGFLLDEAFGSDWRGAAAGGAGPSGWIEDAMNEPSPGDLAERVEAAKAAHEFSSLEELAREIIELAESQPANPMMPRMP